MIDATGLRASTIWAFGGLCSCMGDSTVDKHCSPVEKKKKGSHP